MISKKVALAVAAFLCVPGLATAQTSARVAPVGPSPAPMAVSPFAPAATITESFDVLPGTAPNQCPTGWICSNVSSPAGSTNWFQGNTVVFTAQAGAGYIGANYNNTTGANTISNWLITPVMQFGTGSELRFWTRTVAGGPFADRLEIRASAGGTSTGGSPTTTGDFTTLLGTVNNGLVTGAGTCTVPAGPPTAGGYPDAWCEIRLTNADGIPNSGSGRIAFRYFVTSGGPSGSNSNYIGIDTFSFVEGTSALPMTSTPASTSTITMPAFSVGGAATTQALSFSNPNAAAGTVTCTAPVVTEFQVSPLVINVPANGNASTTISFSATAAGSYAGVLNCVGSGGETFTYDLAASATVAAPPIGVPALGDMGRWLLLLSVLGLGALAMRQRWS